MPTAVAYYRVSTQRQGRSGLGIEAQRAAVARFAEAERMIILQEPTEVETGKRADALDRRPQLTAALALARQLKCPVVVAKLDRLSRDVAFTAGLMVHSLHSCGIWRRCRSVHVAPLRRARRERAAADL
ncbi:recombinase family protein [Mesorhizobium sp.]|uniref:recombinase family protein n=1 Tax=Mesorhizobium sp. TaxID=1871066 RepID=UPI00338FCE22